MEKILKKYTTIPEHLYVNRDADKQLKIIIEEMERPGYVLVARQMGKTNLLFHAQETLQNNQRIFIYIDLSNSCDSEKSFYRNVIDETLELHENIFKDIENEIDKIRHKELSPSKEYSRSLKVLLNKFQGDIIIIFDEVDALQSANYSDHIFAQIRSTYFARTNFPIYNRLTYILSGVIEPTELIKDRDKSPFNIGEKIYLNDFTLEEHNSFIEKSKLQISKDNSKEIFSWTNGNPRLTFDICSDVENFINDNLEINKEVLNSIITNKYLINFDIAPIDHIRELVKKSSQSVRDAIINIHKNLNNISDDLKQTLYLYGIINSAFNEKTVIKNQIISESLSLSWINNLTEKSQITVTYGLAQFNNKEYDKSIETFKQVLDSLDENSQEIETCNYFLGKAYFYLKNFKEAIPYFSFDYKKYNYKREALSLLGNCYLKIDFNKAVNLLENIISDEIHDFAYHNALLNLAINLPKKDNDRALILFQRLYESTFKATESEENNLNQLRTLSLYYQFEIYNNRDNKEECIKKLSDAQKYANKSDSLYIIFLQYLLEEKENLKEELIYRIINQKIPFDTDKSYPISFSEVHLLHYIDLVFDIRDLKLFNQIIDYAIEFLFNKKKKKFDLIYEVSRISTNNQKEYLNYILRYKNEINDSLHMNILRDLSFFFSDDSNKFFKYFDDYLKFFKDTSINITSRDILLFARAIKHYSNLEKFKIGLEVCDIIEQKVDNIVDEELKFESLIIYYWYASLHFSLENKKETIIYANQTLELINKVPTEGTSIIDEKGMKSISEQMNEIKTYFTPKVPIVSNKKYGRNDKIKVKYTNGIIKEGKYKKFSADIHSKKCNIIS